MKIKNKRHINFFSVFVIFLFALLCLAAIYPFWYAVVGSLMSQKEYMQTVFFLWPGKATLESYRYVFSQGNILQPLLVTIFITLAGTFINVFMISIAAYGLSKKFPGVNIVSILMILTMFFSAGLIPNYILFRHLHILNTLWVYLLADMINPFYIILMRTTFLDFPCELEEAASIDGAGKFLTFFRIVLPLCKPTVLAIGLFTAVDYWNTFQQSVYYVTDISKKTLQDFLYMIISDVSMGAMGTGQAIVTENVKLAYTVIAILPILLIYPIIQKHMSAGTLMGAVKG